MWYRKIAVYTVVTHPRRIEETPLFLEISPLSIDNINKLSRNPSSFNFNYET